MLTVICLMIMGAVVIIGGLLLNSDLDPDVQEREVYDEMFR